MRKLNGLLAGLTFSAAALFTPSLSIAQPDGAPPGCQDPYSAACAQDKKDYDPTMTGADKRFRDNIKRFDLNANVEVVGGESANGMHPEVVALFNKSGGVICTGALIAPRVVVTAKHCLVKRQVGVPGTLVKFGDDMKQPATGATAIKVLDAVVMPDRDNLGTDIALVQLEADAPAKPVPLAGDHRVKASAAIRVVGFGRDDPGVPGKREKLMARLVIASVDCAGSVKPKGATQRLSDKEFYGCQQVELVAAGRRDPKTNLHADTCTGDSGGPAYVAPASLAAPVEKFEQAFKREKPSTEDPRFALAGVTARGINFGETSIKCGQGGIYTRISGEVLQWLQQTAKDKWGVTLQPVK